MDVPVNAPRLKVPADVRFPQERDPVPVEMELFEVVMPVLNDPTEKTPEVTLEADKLGMFEVERTLERFEAAPDVAIAASPLIALTLIDAFTNVVDPDTDILLQVTVETTLDADPMFVANTVPQRFAALPRSKDDEVGIKGIPKVATAGGFVPSSDRRFRDPFESVESITMLGPDVPCSARLPPFTCQ